MPSCMLLSLNAFRKPPWLYISGFYFLGVLNFACLILQSLNDLPGSYNVHSVLNNLGWRILNRQDKKHLKMLSTRYQNNQKYFYRPLIRIRSVNRSKGVKLRFGYDHIAPSGVAMPIKWVSTAMFSLVRIRPMFEQEAPKWPWDLFYDADSYTIHVRPKGVKLWFKYD